jgi:hypothetical protein
MRLISTRGASQKRQAEGNTVENKPCATSLRTEAIEKPVVAREALSGRRRSELLLKTVLPPSLAVVRSRKPGRRPSYLV